VDEKATQLHAIASLKVLLDATKPQRGAATSSAANHVKINLKETTLGRPNGNIDATLDSVRYSAYSSRSSHSIVYYCGYVLLDIFACTHCGSHFSCCSRSSTFFVGSFWKLIFSDLCRSKKKE
jgi:hypothetical protein